MSNPKRFYVYVHLNKDKPFYVGKGSKLRAWDLSLRSSAWFNLMQPNPTVWIVKNNLSKRDAILLERALIRSYLTFGYKLANKITHKTCKYL